MAAKCTQRTHFFLKMSFCPCFWMRPFPGFIWRPRSPSRMSGPRECSWMVYDLSVRAWPCCHFSHNSLLLRYKSPLLLPSPLPLLIAEPWVWLTHWETLGLHWDLFHRASPHGPPTPLACQLPSDAAGPSRGGPCVSFSALDEEQSNQSTFIYIAQ